MANTYTQLYVQVVFVVKNRQSLIREEWKQELYKYISGIIKNNEHKLLAINGVGDHVHILIGMKPSQSLADLMQDIKGSSSKWINDKNYVHGKFEWQAGYGAFTYSHSQISRVIKYIQNQEVHHKKNTFKEEYVSFLKAFEISYNENYLFTDVS
ncbi:MAG: transposase IS200-family protein [Stygiobacter sp.]|nr:MAG: transposase IS200-family protein [Stygiobacter sp.]KAF0215804.1 MAG: transposase IS200-family [Ignavibacteria bacterium]